MDQQYIRSLVQSFVEVCIYGFKELVSTKIVINRPYIPDTDLLYTGDISALIRFSGQAQGGVLISMKRALAQKLTNLLIGTEHTTLDEEVMDTLGEIVNIIAGRAKERLENTVKLAISLPTISVDNDYGVT
ncbi:MAG: chemotaxis protein CheX [Treponema sp.]|jgi:chemotaxis protein CheX|nr:chemotaxis protein CheX [Treponema sp.]